MSEAAHQRPGKDAGGTEINPSPFKLSFSTINITILIVCINLQTANLPKCHYIALIPHK